MADIGSTRAEQEAAILAACQAGGKYSPDDIRGLIVACTDRPIPEGPSALAHLTDDEVSIVAEVVYLADGFVHLPRRSP